MADTIATIREILRLIPEMKADFGVEPHGEDCESLLFVGVVKSSGIGGLAERVARDFGPPYKPAGEGAIIKNLFDGFVRDVGGIERDQTLFRRDVAPGLILYCAFWPWGSNPRRTSVRLGVLCYDDELRAQLERTFAGAFR